MRSFQDTFETRKRLCTSDFSIWMIVPLKQPVINTGRSIFSM